ncbi:MAG: hypothetical protein ACHQHK_17505 [Dongiales bacterium]
MKADPETILAGLIIEFLSLRALDGIAPKILLFLYFIRFAITEPAGFAKNCALENATIKQLLKIFHFDPSLSPGPVMRCWNGAVSVLRMAADAAAGKS